MPSSLAFKKAEILFIGMENNFAGIVEEDTETSVGHQVPESIFRRVVNPFLDPDCRSGFLRGRVWFGGERQGRRFHGV